MTPRPISDADLTWIEALNQQHATELSPATEERLRVLVDRAFHAAAIDPEAGFLIAFDQDAEYDSPNFAWFRERHERFVYVDRIAIDPAHRGRALARSLYEGLFAAARASGHARVVCEVNTRPPNPASAAFHHALGFAEVGEARLAAEKRVVYLARTLAP